MSKSGDDEIGERVSANSDIEEMIRNNKRILDLFCVWPRLNNDWKKKWGRHIYTIGLIINAMLNASGAFKDLSDTTTVLINICYTGTSISVFTKFLLTTIFEKNMVKTFAYLRKINFPSQDDPLYSHIARKVKLSKIFYRAFVASAVGIASMLAILALFTIIVLHKRAMPIVTIVDADALPAVVYVLFYLHQFYYTIMIANVIAVFDCQVFTMMSLSAAQLRVLRSRMLEINNCIQDKNCEIGAYDKEINKRLKTCISDYCIVEKFVQSVEDSYCMPILCELMVIITLVCFLLMNVAIVNPLSFDALVSFVFLSILVLTTGGFCFHGNEIMNECENYREALYFLDWTYFGRSTRQTLFIMIERSKKSLRITGGKFFELNNPTFVSICNSAVSYFMVVYHLYQDQTSNENTN